MTKNYNLSEKTNKKNKQKNICDMKFMQFESTEPGKSWIWAS